MGCVSLCLIQLERQDAGENNCTLGGEILYANRVEIQDKSSLKACSLISKPFMIHCSKMGFCRLIDLKRAIGLLS